VTAAVIYQSVFYNLSGYAAESRGLARELAKRGLAVQIRHVGPASLEVLAPEECALLKQLEGTAVNPAEALLLVAQPPTWAVRQPGVRCAVMRTMFETDRIRPEWVANCDQFSEVWVPSQQNREAFVASGLPTEKVRVVPGGIDIDLFRPGAPPLALDRRKGFAFLSVFDWSWRKGWDLLLQAYCQEFRPEEEVTLYLKVNQLSQQTSIVSEVHYVVRQALGGRGRESPDVVLLDQSLPEADMPRLYAAADAFVLPSRGEGYGRPYLEAMASGLPVIGTAWGGQTDFLTEEVGFPLPILGLEPVSDYEPREIYRGQRWAAPSVAALRRLMRYLFTHRAEARQKGDAARRAVERGWGYGTVAARMADEIDRITAGRGRCDGRLAAK